MRTKKNLYLVLGVPRNASPDGIRKAYRRLAKTSHPDRTGAQEASSFRDVAEAYGVLSDPVKRRRYNETLDLPKVRPRPIDRGRHRTWAREPEPLVPTGRGGAEPEPLIPDGRSPIDARFSGPTSRHPTARFENVPRAWVWPGRLRVVALDSACPFCAGVLPLFSFRCPYCSGRSAG